MLSSHVVTLRDLGSTNGTFVGEARVRDADLAVGAIVRGDGDGG